MDENITPAQGGSTQTAKDVPLDFDRDIFLRTLMRELSGTLEDLVGLEEASGFISVVGGRVGDYLNNEYRNALHLRKLDQGQVRDVLVDLKRRIHGQFYVIEETPEKIVFGNKACPFAEKVVGRPSLCMMTSNVFGRIAAENGGYSKVALNKTIAQGDPECLVTVYLSATDESDQAEGREYFAEHDD